MSSHFLVLIAALAVTSCEQNETRRNAPNTSITVLVDLSGTWHNARNEDRNRRLLEAVARNIGAASNALPSNALPVTISYLSIGDRTFLEEPLCGAVFRPQLISSNLPDGYVTSPQALTHYLVDSCTALILDLPQEPMTDITAAIVSGSRGQSLSSPTTEILIVLSDFREERSSTYGLQASDIEGRYFLLLYRDIGEDPSVLDQRVADWTERLSSLGGGVVAVADTNVNEQASTLENFILQTVENNLNDRRN